MKRKFLSLLFSASMLSATLYAQEQKGTREKAEIMYKKYEYAKAVVLYEKLAARKDPYLVDLQNLADSYLKMKRYEEAEKWYLEVIKDEKRTDSDLLAYARVLKLRGKYREAKSAFNAYEVASGSSPRVDRAGCDSALKWIASPTIHILKNENTLNSSLADYSPIFVKDSVYFIAEPRESSSDKYGWTGNSYSRIFSAPQKKGSFPSPSAISAMFNKGNFHIGPLCTNKTGTTLYVTKTHSGTEASLQKQASEKFHARVLEIFIYTKDDSGSWKETPFKYNNPKAWSVGHPALSPDENTLYFISDMPGGIGGTDVWYCIKSSDGSWSAPQNCGKNINTEGNELFPTVKADGTLFFSSDRHMGMGGLDIFSSKGSGNQWSEPQNLKYPINSSADDFAFIEVNNETGSTGYLSSNRIGGKGADDIYSFSYTAPVKFVLAVKGTINNKRYKRPVADAGIALFSQNKEIAAKKSSNGKGEFYFELHKDSEYVLKARKAGFLPDSISFNTNGIKLSDTLEYSLNLDPLEKGRTIRLDNIFYDLGKDAIRSDAALILNGLELLMRENPKLKIELSSHTDSRGKDAYNLSLSQRRAQSAVNYLISRGIAKERMVAKGYGETRLINKCGNNASCSDEEHQRNRRTEFTILSN
ncbi:OmpA family protein [Desertivirga brevis]|uniref:OmpA family protein n=1 Tax=Desertivirga brevis TaxID=2810310 RepID=UPI001A9648BF|nr:OmpA family protein [Pedobacter sp. SYSU D00873]